MAQDSLKKRHKSLTTVGSIMTTGVVTLAAEENFSKAVDLMVSGAFRHLVISDDGKKLQGILSDRDLLGARNRISEWRLLKVKQVMSTKLITVKPDTLISDAVTLMLSNRINCLPVIDSTGSLSGIITSTDLLESYRDLLRELATEIS